jgi:hypothetical protein
MSLPSPPRPADPPQFCDYHCPYAAFPPADTAGICRTMSAVWCKQLAELVHKNTPCEWRKRGQKAERPARRARPKPTRKK